jgi:uncharacterized protein involved in exopolysaccharide biosynthesis
MDATQSPFIQEFDNTSALTADVVDRMHEADGSRMRSDETSLLRLASVALRGRRWFVGIPLLCAISTVVVSLFLPQKYTSTTSFRPAVSAPALADLSGLASQFGVSLPGSDPSTSADFYADLLSSRDILQGLVTKKYVIHAADTVRSASLIDLYDINESTPGRTIDRAIQDLSSSILSVTPKRTTNVVKISVTTKWPELSQQMAADLVHSVDNFNVRARQLEADAEYEFMRGRVDSARAELRGAENQLQAFLEMNRDFKSDPRLQFTFDRLSRDVTMRQAIYTTLLQGAEQTRLEAARNTPAIAVVEQPLPPLRADHRHLVGRAAVACGLGLLLSLCVLFLRELQRSAAVRDPNALAELSEEWADLRASFHPSRRRRGRVSAGELPPRAS